MNVIAYYFELATRYEPSTKTFSGWEPRLSLTKPNVPDRSIRNLKELVEKVEQVK